ncbi:MAG TPA: CehA/McbA family metallohydrolase [Candidatus Hydrogenedentes bacterium]|nr:CehA/McbA family metallohydrolase [Candidatus Hydrogenedentota bacterium]HOM47457.1 CehA/McbA family metallohydrolase [Candidatus Hydrogenedentota bacterium]HOR51855.1 CehA/McbA family metallohydrolase [Candidatus Hydrogenedentota bacterium]HPK25497.1 CehA/McbA family metallohydrolase [Candidatus Hydrogenedentota bacterium]HPX85734.1 CehA/McbA family metallohydrolase [Candidatus Hydrogenedentota bacterium]
MIKSSIRFYALCLTALLIAGCAGDSRTELAPPDRSGKSEVETAPAVKPEKAAQQAEKAAARKALPQGKLNIRCQNVLGELLPARVDLLCYEDGFEDRINVPDGVLSISYAIGSYRAYIHVLDNGVPVLVEAEELTITETKPGELRVDLLEGAGGMLPLRGFDSDGDLALDRVELKIGTDPHNAGSIPGKTEFFYDPRVFDKTTQWYCGDLHVHSNYGVGTESVAALVQRAEKAGLDFFAITDRNTLAASEDPAFKSDRMVLLPAMEWGTDEQGVALVYGPRTRPEMPSTVMAAQAECLRIQAQGGAFVVAHPCFPGKPWQWGLSFVNGIEVWFRNWREVPPMGLPQLGAAAQERKDGRLLHSIAAAVAAVDLGDLSANGQANLFYDYEQVRGLMAGITGGSGSGSPKVPLGRPVTYVHARELSVAGILEGIRLGRTYVSSGTNGPRILFVADVLSDGKVDVGIGGVVPLNAEVTFEVVVHNAVGKKLQVIENGRPIRTIPINAQDTGIRFKRFPTQDAAYRVRVISPADPKSEGFGPLEVHALTSPIYARDISAELLWRNPNFDPDKSWVRIQNGDLTDVDVQLPDQPPQPVQGW